MSRSNREVIAVLLLPLLILVFGTQPSTCKAAPLPSSFTWLTPPEVVDTGVPATSYAGGTSLIRTSSACAIVYAKQGDIYLVFRDADVWQPPLRVTDDPADSRDPQIVQAGSTWHVFWEDDRSGHAEAMTRRWNGTAWSAEEVFGPDDSPTRAPSATVFDWDKILVACQEGPDPNTVITARVWDGQTWGAPTTVSTGSARAQEPAVGGNMRAWVAWSDTRHGQAEIYLRAQSGNGAWDSETRLTNMNGNCRRPSIHVENCCGDFLNDALLVAFENDQTGRSEVWAIRWWLNDAPWAPVRISLDDSTPSRVPNVGGFTFTDDSMMGGWFDRMLVTWTDGTTPGACTHRFGFYPPDQDTLTTAGISGSLAAACAGAPWASLAFAWVEEIGGVPSLVVRQAHTRGCTNPSFEPAPALLLGPEGYPPTPFRALDNCPTTMPWPGAEVRFFIFTLDAQVTWDAQQPRPETPPIETDEDGYAYVSVRGGGCSTTGLTFVNVEGVDVGQMTGARSPDVDGDCVVGSDDLAYVQSKLGTNDFCSDLVADGVVDAQDVAVVQTAMGDMCSQLVSVGDGSPAAIPGLRVFPNPCRESTSLLFTASAAAPVEATIADASGRIVRRLEGGPASGILTLHWDIRDARGQSVPSGVYFARVRCAGQEVTRTVIVAR